jgi:RNA polymerase sigma-70 factor, ECF subfamily
MYGLSISMNDMRIFESMALDKNRGFRMLVEEHADRVFKLSYSILRNRNEADDATQEVFIKIFKKFYTFDGRSKLSTWIYRITVNHCFNRLRMRENRHISIQDVNETEQGRVDGCSMDYDTRALISDALGRLPAELRTVIILKDMEGKSYEEIGRILNCKTGTVSSRLHLARKTLRHDLASFIDAEDLK